jgi:hypothetical protein
MVSFFDSIGTATLNTADTVIIEPELTHGQRHDTTRTRHETTRHDTTHGQGENG